MNPASVVPPPHPPLAWLACPRRPPALLLARRLDARARSGAASTSARGAIAASSTAAHRRGHQPRGGVAALGPAPRFPLPSCRLEERLACLPLRLGARRPSWQP
eukprot:scaffold66283_cov22-Tisochrysis_lutea.AAC.1